MGAEVGRGGLVDGEMGEWPTIILESPTSLEKIG